MTTAESWLKSAAFYIHSRQERDFRAHFGISSASTAWLWNTMLLEELDPYFSGTHLLWTLYFLKTAGTSWSVIKSQFNIADERTFKKWLGYTLDLIDVILPKVFTLQFFIFLILFSVSKI
jgi:hypothetical protein